MSGKFDKDVNKIEALGESSNDETRADVFKQSKTDIGNCTPFSMVEKAWQSKQDKIDSERQRSKVPSQNESQSQFYQENKD